MGVPGSAGRPTIVGHPDQPFFGGSKATLANTSRRCRGRPLGDPSSRVYRRLGRLRRFVISVERRVISVDPRVVSVEPRRSWG